MSPIVPSQMQPIVDRSGKATTELIRFFNALVQAPPIPAPVTPGASPYSYVAGSSGFDAVSGGTVSAVSIKRSTTTVPTGVTSGLFPVANGDTVIITYSVAPTVNFIPG